MNFGTNSASEIFQNAISEQIKEIPGGINISDDIIINGKNQLLHDQVLHTVFCKFTDVGLTLKPEKCELNKDSFTFFGFVFHQKGPEKVKAIFMMLPYQEVRSFLDMTNYSVLYKVYPAVSLNRCEISQRNGPSKEMSNKDKLTAEE